jgi:hypothetical protein
MQIIKRIFIISLIFSLLGCFEQETSNCSYDLFEIEKSMISSDNTNIWDLCPVFNLEEAIELSKEYDKNILIIFYSTIFSGNDDKIWKTLNFKKNSNLIGEKFILCPLNIEEQGNKKNQLLFTNSLELASIVVVSSKKEVLSNVLFYQGRSIEDEELNVFLESFPAKQDINN